MDCCPGEERLSQPQSGYEQCLPGSRSQMWSPWMLSTSVVRAETLCLSAFVPHEDLDAIVNGFVLEGTKVLMTALAFCFSECLSWHVRRDISVSRLSASAFFGCLTLISNLASRIQTGLGTLSQLSKGSKHKTTLLFSLLSSVFILKPGLPYFRLTQLPSATNFTLPCSLGMPLFFF